MKNLLFVFLCLIFSCEPDNHVCMVCNETNKKTERPIYFCGTESECANYKYKLVEDAFINGLHWECEYK